MPYKYSICYPNKKDIEYPSQILEEDQVLDLVKNYPWNEQLDLTKKLNENEIFYSPSIDFTNTQNKISFCLTAHIEKGQTMFSIWFKRPKEVNVLFGILGKKNKIVVDDFWSLSLEGSTKYLEYFLNNEYQKIENLYK
jgi:hypothetical protein